MGERSQAPRAVTRAVGALERHWRLVVAGTALAALLVRLGVIATTGGGSDLRIYVYFARLLAAGENPYTAPAGGTVDPVYGDNPPLLFALFAGVLAIRDAPETLRIAFALADAAVIVLIGGWLRRPLAWRLGLMLFYGFSPFVLYSWTAHAEDKTLLFLGLAGLLVALERGSHAAAWLLTAGLTALKGVGAFWALPLALATWRARGGRAARLALGAFAVVFAAAQAPFFPSSLEAFARRADRMQIDPPIHASLLKPLAEVGLYDPWLARACTVAALVTVGAAFARRRIEAPVAVVLSMVAAYAFLPDQSDNRVLLLVLPVLLLTRLTPLRYVTLWVLSTVAAVGLVVELNGVPAALAGLAPVATAVFGTYGSMQHVVIVNALLLWVLACHVRDLRGQGPGAEADGVESPASRGRGPALTPGASSV